MRRPLTGALLGLFIGLALAVVAQQQGIWPLDRLTVFLFPAITGLIGLLLLSWGRTSKSMATLIISFIILLPMVVWGAIGLGELNEQGELNGGCLVMATSDVDTTTVSDSSKQDPFEIDPDGGLQWIADSSPQVFEDYIWEIWVDIGGIEVTLDSGTEPNDAGSVTNGDEVDDIRGYAATRDIDVDQLSGVYKVGGFASTCDGFGFVLLRSDGLGVIPLTALIIALVLLIILIILMFTGRGAPTVVESTATVIEGETVVMEGSATENLEQATDEASADGTDS